MLAKCCQDDDFPPSLVQSDTPALAGVGIDGVTADNVPRPGNSAHYMSWMCIWAANPAKPPCLTTIAYQSTIILFSFIDPSLHVDCFMD